MSKIIALGFGLWALGSGCFYNHVGDFTIPALECAGGVLGGAC